MGRRGPGLALLAAAAVAAALAIAAGNPALAADLPAPAPAYNPPPAYRPALYDWTGIYAGGQVGAGLLQDDVTATASTLQAAGTQTQYSPFAVIGGGQVGVNLEMAPFVVGVEGAWIASAISGSQQSATLVAVGGNDRATSAPLWYAMATGRVGYAANDTLFYVKGGAAWMHVNYTEDILTAGSPSSTAIVADTRKGFTVGGGIEYAFNEYLSARLEYDFLDFGTANYNFTLTTPAGAVLVAPFAIKSDTQMMTLGFNYRFNWVQRSPLAGQY
jgi:outer membrane immunogenic protein